MPGCPPIRNLLLLGVGLLAATTAMAAPQRTRPGSSPSASAVSVGTRSGPVTLGPVTNVGCCTDPDVMNFGYHVDFGAWGDGEEITDQLRGSGLLFGRAVNPTVPPTMVLTDPSRASLCQAVLNGEPAFSGWEYFIFVDPVTSRWATVQKVGASVGYADREQTCFLAAYDKDGNLLGFEYNSQVGFQFLSVERPTADISRVLIGDCDGPFCYQDGGGSAANCLTYSGPVASSVPLPAQIGMPPPPIIQGVPGVTALGTALVSAILLAGGVLALRRRVRGGAG